MYTRASFQVGDKSGFVSLNSRPDDVHVIIGGCGKETTLMMTPTQLAEAIHDWVEKQAHQKIMADGATAEIEIRKLLKEQDVANA